MAELKFPSQKEMVWDIMCERGSITPLEALQEVGAFRLSAIIYELKHKDGKKIKTLMIEHKNKWGKIIQFAKYVPEPPEPAKDLFEFGQQHGVES